MDKEIMEKKYEAPMLSWVRMELEQVIAVSHSGTVSGSPQLEEYDEVKLKDFDIQF